MQLISDQDTDTNSGIAIILAYPDTVVRTATRELSRYLWPILGIGGINNVKAGHAALVLVCKNKGSILYFDFGRYITSEDYGRVRSVKTDVELSIPFKAIFKNNEIDNLNQLLLYFESQSKNTHGTGRMLASINSQIDYKKALYYAQTLQNRGEVPYGAFTNGGSNCARFVCDLLEYSTTNVEVRKALSISKIITPSPVSNLLKGKTEAVVYEVFQQQINTYTNKSVQKEHIKCLTARVSQVLNFKGTIDPDVASFEISNGQWLSGIGSGAWFVLQSTNETSILRLQRFSSSGDLQSNTFVDISKSDFCINQEYSILHGTTDSYLKVIQSKNIYSFETFVKC